MRKNEMLDPMCADKEKDIANYVYLIITLLTDIKDLFKHAKLSYFSIPPRFGFSYESF